MSSPVLVVAPHPDDETLGCGGTMLKLRAEGAAIHWVIMTRLGAGQAPAARRKAREAEVQAVKRYYRFSGLHQLPHPSAGLDTVPRARLVGELSEIINSVRPETLFVCGANDAHSDHRVTFEAVMSAAKSFRAKGLTRLLMYETLSETDAAPALASSVFLPNSYSGIDETLEGKIKALSLYQGETAPHPFPRSMEGVRALALLRGAQSGRHYAEAFQVLREVW